VPDVHRELNVYDFGHAGLRHADGYEPIEDHVQDGQSYRELEDGVGQ
jgi:hypothetical protein